MITFSELAANTLCPPGDGVYTVKTAADIKTKFQAKYSDSPDLRWKSDISNLSGSSTCVLGVPSDCGGGVQRGANWGPLFIRSSLIEKEHELCDLGDVRVIPQLLDDKYLNSETIKSCKKALYGGTDNDFSVSPLSIQRDITRELFRAHPTVKLLTLGGDHSVSRPAVEEFIEAKKQQGTKVGIIHFDAHTDLMSERLGIDTCFATWAFHAIKKLDTPSQFVQIGIRSSAKTKCHWEEELGVTQIWTKEVKEFGPMKTASIVIKQYKEEDVDEVYISFDVDALDSSYVGATGTPEENGLFPHEAITIISLICSEFKLTGADVIEFAPFVNLSPTAASPFTPSLMSITSITEKLIENMRG